MEITDLKINGYSNTDWTHNDYIFLLKGDKLEVEAKLSFLYPIGWVPEGWHHLNFYLAQYYDGGVIWKKEDVLTNLFTGKASVTIDTSNLPITQREYQLCVYYGITPETMHDFWVLFNGQYAYYYTPVWFMESLGNSPPGNNPPGNNSSGNNSSGNNDPENTIGHNNLPANAAAVPMQNTGTPIGLAVIGLIGIIGVAIYGKVK